MLQIENLLHIAEKHNRKFIFYLFTYSYSFGSLFISYNLLLYACELYNA